MVDSYRVFFINAKQQSLPEKQTKQKGYLMNIHWDVPPPPLYEPVLDWDYDIINLNP